ncbi:MAG: hypothetical protein EB127_04610 [Alphaproteobacteria bacterium]|nr:hypothetical protein [Alphaproteobacteria bacterium]
MSNIERIGDLLKKVRNARSLDLYKVSEDLRIRKKYLEAIEAGSFTEMPGDAYVNGYVKMYADYLGVSEEVRSGQLPKSQLQAKKLNKTKKHIDDNWILVIIATVAVTILFMLVIYRNENRIIFSKPHIEELLEEDKYEFLD